jgi:YYY domain-containing protein
MSDSTSIGAISSPPHAHNLASRNASRLRVWFARLAPVILVLILVVGGYLRLSHINWDAETHIHPDERFLTMVEDALDLPSSFGEFMDSTTSPMSPYNRGYGFFVYGTLPIFIVRVAAEALNRFNLETQWWTIVEGIPIDLTGYGGVHFVGRALSGLFDLACIPLIYFISRRLYDRRVGLLAALFYAFAVLPLQQSHFFTVDTFGTFFALLTFYFAVRVMQGSQPGRRGGGWPTYVAMGASLGATVACRINLAPMAGIVLLAASVRAWDDWHASPDSQGRVRDGAWLNTLVQATLFRLVLMGAVAAAVFRVAQPYAFGGTSVLDFSLADAWQDNMRQIRLLIGGDADYPPGHQWASRTPFVFPFVNMVVWGLGAPLGLTAWAGWTLAALQILRGTTIRPDGRAVRMHILPVAWIGGMFLWQGLQYVQSMRYLLPIYPTLAMMAAWLLWWIVDAARARAGRPALTGAAYGLMAVVTIATMLWGWGFLAIYRRPLSRVTASRWIYENVPPGSVIANEHWDDGLPLRIDGKDGFGAFGYRGLSTSSDGNMQMYNEDTPEKRELLYQWLNEADYIALSSNRLWGSIPRLPLRYPMTTLYYDLLFQGKLGFEEVQRVTSFPTIFGIEFDDTGAEEAFSVYDHPEVRVFKKTPEYSEELARSYFDPIDLEHTIQYWPKQVSAAPTALLLPDADAARQQAGGTWSKMFDPDALVNRSPVAATAAWLLLLIALGVVGFPITFSVLRNLGDRGYGVSKTLALLLLAWLSWLGPSLKLTPFSRGYIALCLLGLAAVSGFLAWRRRAEMGRFIRARGGLLLAEEALFLMMFVMFLAVRWGNPDLWHPARGGEKPMDLAYLNAVIKSTIFPPYDPWFAGGFINYYYFGFVIIATLVKLTGVVPSIAYNLAVPSLFALLGVGAFSVAYNLAVGDGEFGPESETQSPGGASKWGLLSGFAAALLVAIVGNLGNVRLLIVNLATVAPQDSDMGGPLAQFRHALGGFGAVIRGDAALSFPNDWWFWNASRVIPDTINEFPFFTFTYADLHAHMIALPIFVLGLAVATALARVERRPSSLEARLGPWYVSLREIALIAGLGFVAGALKATNSWDFPTMLILGVIAISIGEITRHRRIAIPGLPDQRLIFLFHRFVGIGWRSGLLVAAAMLFFHPFGKYYATAYGGLESWSGERTLLTDYFVVYGLFIALATIFLLSELADQLRRQRIAPRLADLAPVVAVAVLTGAGIGWIIGAKAWLIALPLAAFAVYLASGRDLPAVRRFGLLLLALAFAITMGVEVVRLRDDIGRMNTVFKFYLQAWTLLGLACAYGLSLWPARATSWKPVWRWLAWVTTVVLLGGAVLYPATAARAKILDRFSEEASPRGLDGMAYMDRAEYFDNGVTLALSDDKAAMLWMMQNVSGSPVILEANTPLYRWGNRISIYTGLPSVIGWDWHQKQQRSVVPGAAIDKRLMDVQEIYNTEDLNRAQQLLNHYGVSLVIVGDLERAYYSPEGLSKFDRMVEQGYLKQVYPAPSSASTAVRIYSVADREVPLYSDVVSGIGPQPVPTLTPVAQRATPEPASTAHASGLSPLGGGAVEE